MMKFKRGFSRYAIGARSAVRKEMNNSAAQAYRDYRDGRITEAEYQEHLAVFRARVDKEYGR